MSPYKLHFVCSGNLYRSPLAEALTRRELDQRGIGGVIVSSSGTNHHPLFLEQRDSPERIVPIVQRAVANALYSGELEEVAHRALAQQGVDDLGRCVDFLVQREERARDLIFKTLNLAIPDGYQATQAVDQDLILAMDQGVLGQIACVYSGSEFTPPAYTLSDFLGREADIKNAFGHKISAYFAVRDQLEELVPQVVDKVLEEL